MGWPESAPTRRPARTRRKRNRSCGRRLPPSSLIGWPWPARRWPGRKRTASSWWVQTRACACACVRACVHMGALDRFQAHRIHMRVCSCVGGAWADGLAGRGPGPAAAQAEAEEEKTSQKERGSNQPVLAGRRRFRGLISPVPAPVRSLSLSLFRSLFSLSLSLSLFESISSLSISSNFSLPLSSKSRCLLQLIAILHFLHFPDSFSVLSTTPPFVDSDHNGLTDRPPRGLLEDLIMQRHLQLVPWIEPLVFFNSMILLCTSGVRLQYLYLHVSNGYSNYNTYAFLPRIFPTLKGPGHIYYNNKGIAVFGLSL